MQEHSQTVDDRMATPPRSCKEFGLQRDIDDVDDRRRQWQ